MKHTSQGRSYFAQLFKSSLAQTVFILFLVEVPTQAMARLLIDIRNTAFYLGLPVYWKVTGVNPMHKRSLNVLTSLLAVFNMDERTIRDAMVKNMDDQQFIDEVKHGLERNRSAPT